MEEPLRARIESRPLAGEAESRECEGRGVHMTLKKKVKSQKNKIRSTTPVGRRTHGFLLKHYQ
jgi:hypothetical protein